MSEIDELASAARDSPGNATLNRLWQAVYRLDRWYLLPTGDTADPRPMVGVVEDRTFLLAFTSDTHVRDFAHRQGRIGADGGVPAMAVTPEDLAQMAPTLAQQGVAGVLFDQGVNGFVAPVAGLESLGRQFGSPSGPPPTDTPPPRDAPAPG